ncbi:hypothetical protein FRB90_011724 [Tulasnella sp. 427]|nr:hypothetical protein FRB90_011724 [Tulasnella sp. 427]
MKFGKTYTALIYDPTFPQEWRDRAIDYRQLKKLINQVVIELSSLGLNPAVLQRFITGPSQAVSLATQASSEGSASEASGQSYAAIYEVTRALTALSNLYASILQHCELEVESLSNTISSTARPRSEGGKSDLDTWRSIFQLWVESEIFESLSERYHGEIAAPEAEKRLKRFADVVIERGLDGKRAMRIADSRDALSRFYALNVLILDLKKFQLANAEATRKILKKHEKRTALPSSVVLPSLTLTVRGNESLPRVLLCMITETLLPVIPSIDVSLSNLSDSIVAIFSASANLDVALMNFMKDWFPKEVRIKAKENGEEANKEMAEELGIDNDCCIM